VPLSTPWLIVSLALYVAVVLVGLLGYTPMPKRQIALLESHGTTSQEYRGAATGGIVLGVVIGVITLAVVVLMVAKPALWS
jgi:uncharacterized membrane protein